MAAESRRTGLRASRRYKVSFDRTVCFTVNLSHGGFCAESVRVVPPGTEVRGTIAINGELVPFTGRVAWAKLGDPRMGLRGRMGIRFTKAQLPPSALPPSAARTIPEGDGG